MFINNRVPSKWDTPTNTIIQNHSINNQYVFIILNISLNSLFMSIINSNDTSFITTGVCITLYSSYSFLHSFIPPSLTHHSYHPFPSFILFSITILYFSHSSLSIHHIISSNHMYHKYPLLSHPFHHIPSHLSLPSTSIPCSIIPRFACFSNLKSQIQSTHFQ